MHLLQFASFKRLSVLRQVAACAGCKKGEVDHGNIIVKVTCTGKDRLHYGCFRQDFSWLLLPASLDKTPAVLLASLLGPFFSFSYLIVVWMLCNVDKLICCAFKSDLAPSLMTSVHVLCAISMICFLTYFKTVAFLCRAALPRQFDGPQGKHRAHVPCTQGSPSLASCCNQLLGGGRCYVWCC